MGRSSSKPVVHQHSMADYKDISLPEKNKLKSFFQEIVTKASVDFSNPEIQDIQSAVTEMIGKIKAGINERGVLNITRLVICGSMAEKTAMWKTKGESKQPFIEFDFLAVLQATGYAELGCQECLSVNTLPANLELLEKYHRELYDLLQLKQNYMLDKCFIRETNNCLVSCGCLEVKYRNQCGFIFKPSSTCSKTQQGCAKCTVDKPTGTLRVKTSVEIRGTGGNQCSLIFKWTGKAKALCTRNKWCLPETEKMDNLTIHIDFLPALKVFQSKQQSHNVAACSSSDLVLKPTSSEYEHYCFLVPKHCVVCDKHGYKGTWRRSGCRAEIDTIVSKMSTKHRKCYQVLKHLTGLMPHHFNNYHLKITVLHHNSSCPDASEDCAKCVFKVLDELQHAYERRQLKSLHSQVNLLEQVYSDKCNFYSARISRLKEAMFSAVSVSDSLSSFLENLGF